MLIDEKGRILGRLNIIDLVIVLLVCLVVAAAYRHISAPHRLATPYPMGDAREWVNIDLRFSDDQAWLAEFARPGAQQRDGRSGQVVAEILGPRSSSNGTAVVAVRIAAVKDAQGRLFYDNKLLVPGQLLRIETDACVIEGAVSHIERAP